MAWPLKNSLAMALCHGSKEEKGSPEENLSSRPRRDTTLSFGSRNWRLYIFTTSLDNSKLASLVPIFIPVSIPMDWTGFLLLAPPFLLITNRGHFLYWKSGAELWAKHLSVVASYIWPRYCNLAKFQTFKREPHSHWKWLWNFTYAWKLCVVRFHKTAANRQHH